MRPRGNTRREDAGRTPPAQRKPTPVACLCGALCSLLLAVTLFAAGFAACCAPVTTQALSASMSNFSLSVYGHDQLTDLAVATRDYTVDGISRDKLYGQVVGAARESARDPELGKTYWWAGVAEDAGLFDGARGAADIARALADDERYCLDEAALVHLDECYLLINSIAPWLALVAAGAIALVVGLRVSGHRQILARVLIGVPAVLLAAMLAIGVWALADFDGFFTWFHGVFFPQGGWVFPYDSLLICMYPEAFWTSMAALWFTVTAVACAVSLAYGLHLRRA